MKKNVTKEYHFETAEENEKVLKGENVHENLTQYVDMTTCSEDNKFVGLSIKHASNHIDEKILKTFNENAQTC